MSSNKRTKEECASMAPRELRSLCRTGNFTSQTAGYCQGYAQANLCILPKSDAFDFLLFCQRNPKPCPLLECLSDGEALLGTNIDIRQDLPKYRIYENGVLTKEVSNIVDIWREDFVTFVIGCSFSFEEAMLRAGLSVRHLETGIDRTVPMYNTNLRCNPAGRFSGNMVVSMRPFSPQDAIHAISVTSRYPRVHGCPVHINDPLAIGITDINKPDYGDSVEIRSGEIPVFWACGVTPQAIVMNSK